MIRRFRDVLDEKLEQLRRGQTPDLSPYGAGTPHGDELADLLAIAAALQAVPAPEPSALAVARGKQRLLAAMAESERTNAPRALGLGPLLKPVFAAAMATVVCLVLVFAVNALGERSLPGSVFHPVKTVKERIQVRMADTPREQAAVHLRMAKRRLNDLQRVTLRDGAADLALLDAMTREMDAALEALAQVPVTQSGALVADLASVARRQQSTLLWVQRHSSPEQQAALAQAIVRAHETYRMALAAPAQGLKVERPLSGLAIAAIVEFKGPVLGEDPDVLTVGSHQVGVVSVTDVERRPDLGATVEVRAARLEDGRLVALSIRQTAPPAEGLWVRVNGTITGAYDSTWLINGHPIVFSAATNLVGWLQPGAHVEASGLMRADGAVLAHDVEVETTEREVNLTGPVAERSPDQWVVAGVPVKVVSATYIDESEALAAQSRGASVRAVRQSDGTLVARSITALRDEPQAAVVVKDVVVALQGDVWTVGDWTVATDAQTRIVAEGNPMGHIAEVSAERLPDGTLRAVRIAVGPAARQETVRIAFQGSAQWVDGMLTVAGRPVKPGEATSTWAQDRALPALQPAPGRAVAVEGWLQPDGTVIAETLRALRPEKVTEVHGIVREIGEGRMLLDERTVYVDECVEVVAPGATASLADIAPGLLVTIVGEPGPDGSLLAWKVLVGGIVPDKGPAPKPTAQPEPGQPPAPTPVAPAPSATPSPTTPVHPKGGHGTPVPVSPTPTPTPEPTVTPTAGPSAPAPGPGGPGGPSLTPTPWPTVVIKPRNKTPLPVPPTETPTGTPMPTPMPEPTGTPMPTPMPEPTGTPMPTPTPEPTDTPPPAPGPGGPWEPTATPTATPTAGPSAPAPGPGGPPEPTATTTAMPTVAPKRPRPLPTLQPPGKPMPMPTG